MDWQNLFENVTQVVQGAAHGATIDGWLQLDDNAAVQAVVQFVQTHSMDDIDAMDSALLIMAIHNLSPGVRCRLIKFYATLKTYETIRFQQFRGFPAV